jgi:hypothetical protein
LDFARPEKRPSPLASAITERKLSLSCLFLELGFSLDLYSDYEMDIIAWQLSWIIGARKEILKKQKGKTSFFDFALLSLRSGNTDDRVSETDIKLLEALRLFYGGVFILARLLKMNKLATAMEPSTTLYSREAHFNQRFGVFHQLAHPEFPDYADFLMSTQDETDVCFFVI